MKIKKRIGSVNNVIISKVGTMLLVKRQRSKLIKTKMKNIKLYTLHPVDIVVTKIGRLTDRDIEDIRSCIKKFHLKKEDIVQRSKLLGPIGHEKTYQVNLKQVIKENYS